MQRRALIGGAAALASFAGEAGDHRVYARRREPSNWSDPSGPRAWRNRRSCERRISHPLSRRSVCADALTVTNNVPINTFTLAARLPTIYNGRIFIAAGGLMSYGPNTADLSRRAGDTVH